MRYVPRLTHLVDATFLGRNLGDRFAEDKDVVDAEGRDARNDRLWDEVRRVVSASDANLKHRRVNLEFASA